jgi:uncharacterized protein involved in type VI secretion and phage assembly
VRVSQNWAGKGWGGVFIPHVGQEVVVSFLEGDPDMLLVTGRVYNAENMQAIGLAPNKTQSAIRDHSGNEILMEGKGGVQDIRIHAVKDMHETVDHDHVSNITNDETTTIGGNRTETVVKNETITINGNRTENVVAAGYFFGAKPPRVPLRRASIWPRSGERRCRVLAGSQTAVLSRCPPSENRLSTRGRISSG